MKNLTALNGAKRLSKLEQKSIIGGQQGNGTTLPFTIEDGSGGPGSGNSNMGVCFGSPVMIPCDQYCANGTQPICNN